MNFYCKECGTLVAVLKEGSKLKKRLVFLCDKCYKQLQDGNLFNNIFGGMK
jgi:RNase P subunit RPR2